MEMGIQLCQPLLLRPSLVLDLRLLSGKISLFDIGLNQLKPSKDGSTSGLHPDNKDSKELNPNGLSPLNFSSDSSAIGLDGDTDDSSWPDSRGEIQKNSRQTCAHN